MIADRVGVFTPIPSGKALIKATGGDRGHRPIFAFLHTIWQLFEKIRLRVEEGDLCVFQRLVARVYHHGVPLCLRTAKAYL